MKKRFLGIICFLYTGIILYVWIFDILKNFIAPNMQIYLKLSVIPMFIMGLVICLNNKVNYKFRFSDLVLLLPIIMVVIANDGRLSASFASNRVNNYIKEVKETVTNDKDIVKEKDDDDTQEDTIDVVKEDYDFSNPYFNIVDSSYDTLSNYISYVSGAQAYENKTIKVRGFTLNKADYLPSGYFALGKYSVSCCTADALFVGFIVKEDNNKIINNKWYEIEGVLRKGKDKQGVDIMYIKIVNIKEIDSKNEEEYVYPCYSYDNGTCSEVAKYDLQY